MEEMKSEAAAAAAALSSAFALFSYKLFLGYEERPSVVDLI